MVECSVFLFSKPENEVDLEKANSKDFKLLGEELKERMDKVAEIVEKLEYNGWERSGGLYDVYFYKKIGMEEAERELKKLGIDKEEVNLMETEDEEDYIDEDFDDEDSDEPDE